MADYDGIISPSPEWVDIPSLSTSAIALGGAAGAGAMNAQAVAFAKRTNYLINYSVQISPATGNAGIGTSSPLGRLQIGDASANANNKIVFGKAQAATETNLPAIGQRSAGVANDLAIAATSSTGSVKIFTGNSTNSGEIGTGSNAERVIVNSFGEVGVGTSTPFLSSTTRGNVSINGSAGSIMNLGVGDVSKAYLYTDGTTFDVWNVANGAMRFGTNNLLRATFGADGIFNKIVSSSAGSETVGIRFTNGTQNLGSIRSYNQTGYNQHLRFYTSSGTSSSTENFAMTIDSAGNLGLGVTPNAWHSASKAIDIGTLGAIQSGNGVHVGLWGNAFYNTSAQFAYKTSAAASYYQQAAGIHSWYTAPSGTAGSMITFTQAMTLDAAGNLFLGIPPNSWSSGKVLQFGPPASGFLFNDSNNTQLGSNAYFSSGWKYQTSSVGASTYQQTSGGHVWNTAPAGVADNAISWTTAMTLSPAGNLGIGGTPSGSYKLEVTGSTSTTSTSMARGFGLNATGGSVSTGMNAPASDTLALWTNSSEKLRITSTGDQINYGTGALKIHEGTTAQRPSTPSEGMIRKNSTLGIIEGYSGGGYVSLEAGRLIKVTSSTTVGHSSITLDQKTEYIIVEMIGGGGAGGNIQVGPYTTNYVCCASDGSPGFGVKLLLSKQYLQSTLYYFVGSGGVAGGSAGSDGANGTGTTLSLEPTTGSMTNYYTAGGGLGGKGNSTSSLPPSVSNTAQEAVATRVGSGNSWIVLETAAVKSSQRAALNSLGQGIFGYPATGTITVSPMTQFGSRGGGGFGGLGVQSFPAYSQGYTAANGMIRIYEYS